MDSDSEVGVYGGLLFEMRTVVCGASHDSSVSRSAGVSRVPADVPSRGLLGHFRGRDAAVCRVGGRVAPRGGVAEHCVSLAVPGALEIGLTRSHSLLIVHFGVVEPV